MPTQQALYADLAERSFDPELSWAEHELPERLRTKHVHRLHPYLGKFVPQLVETFLRRHFRPGQRILDPFAGSGTTLVECTTFGAHSVGVDVSAFNVLLASVKTARYDAAAVERDLTGVLQRAGDWEGEPGGVPPSDYLRAWYHGVALDQLLRYRGALQPPGERRSRPHRAEPRRPLGPPDDALRARLPPPAADRAVRVPQALARVRADRRCGQVPAPLHARHGPARA